MSVLSRGMQSTGVDANGNAVLFNSEVDDAVTDITFLVSYTRSTPFNQFAQNTRRGIAPCAEVFVGAGNVYQAGQGTRVGPNEAAALVKAGVAKYA